MLYTPIRVAFECGYEPCGYKEDITINTAAKDSHERMTETLRCPKCKVWNFKAKQTIQMIRLT